MARLRSRAWFGALAVVVAATGCKFTGVNHAPTESAVDTARNWLVTQQQTGGGFEVAGAPGFETPDAILALAEAAQQQYAWDAGQARTAVAAVTVGGKSALDAVDDFADGAINAGQAAKLIVLVARPLGYDPAAFNPQGDASSRNLIAALDAGAQPDGSYGAFNATLYAALAKRLVSQPVSAATVALIRAGQEPSGGWDYSGDPTGADADVDTTSLAVQALVAAGVAENDADLAQALTFLAQGLGASGAWSAFGSDDPNSTATAIVAVTAAGHNVGQACWRNLAAPATAANPYASPVAWLRAQVATDGHIASPNDAFPPVNTFATTQGIQALRRGWLPVAFFEPKGCSI